MHKTLTDAKVLRALLEERVDDLLRLRLLHGQRRRGDLLADDLLLLNRLHGGGRTKTKQTFTVLDWQLVLAKTNKSAIGSRRAQCFGRRRRTGRGNGAIFTVNIRTYAQAHHSYTRTQRRRIQTSSAHGLDSLLLPPFRSRFVRRKIRARPDGRRTPGGGRRIYLLRNHFAEWDVRG